MVAPSLSLILPTLDERENVERFVPLLLDEIAQIGEIVVVDDASSDGTPEAVERLAVRDPRIRLVRRHGVPCLTAAIRDGVLAARCPLVGWMDADLVLRPSDLRRLIDAVAGGADVAIASRFTQGGAIKGQTSEGFLGRLAALRNLRTTEDPWLGVALSWALNVLVVPAIVGRGVRDYTSGILVGRSEIVRSLELRGDHGEYFIDLFMQLFEREIAFVEVGYRVQPRQYGRSKTGNNLRDYSRRGRAYLRTALRARLGATSQRR